MPFVGLEQHVVGDRERLAQRRGLVDHGQQALVRDHEQRVDLGAQLGQALVGLAQAPPALELERLRDHGHGERTAWRASRATTGPEPVPVPPPMPAVMNTMSASPPRR
jgi:hypothetical protein